MKIADMRIGRRLGAGFGLLLLMMASLIAVGTMALTNIGQVTSHIIENDWVKASAANTINVNTRANARNTMELFLRNDAVDIDNIHQRIETNRKTITQAMQSLGQLAGSTQEQRLIDKVKEERGRYVASFQKVDKLLMAGQREAATSLMLAETLPALDALQDTVKQLSRLQNEAVAASGMEAMRDIDAVRTSMFGLGGAILASGIALACWLTRSITRPMGEAVAVARSVAAGDLTRRIAVRTNDETGHLLQALQDMSGQLQNIAVQVRTGTDIVATASSQIAAGNLDLSSRTEEQASSLEETAASMDELTRIVKKNADSARQANQLTLSAAEVAVKGGAVIAQVVATMGSINASSRKIGDIIGVIDGIAFQTNILALNAAVEAARAGEQGRGFAVVATEVRGLAQRSAAAAKEIKALIGASVGDVEVGARLVDQAGTTMQEIVDSVTRVTDIVGEISAASETQSTGIEQINQAIRQMDEVTQQNAALVEQAAAASASLQDQATDLAQVVSIFKLDGSAAAGSLVALAPASLAAVPDAGADRAQLRGNRLGGLAASRIATAASRPRSIAHAQPEHRDEWVQS